MGLNLLRVAELATVKLDVQQGGIRLSTGLSWSSLLLKAWYIIKVWNSSCGHSAAMGGQDVRTSFIDSAC